jgi:hypothetical protein
VHQAGGMQEPAEQMGVGGGEVRRRVRR